MSEVLSPGVAYGCFELLDVLSAMPMSMGSASCLGKFGVVSSERVVRCAQLLKWVELDAGGMLVLTLRGQSIRAMSRTQDRLREALLDLVEANDPPWVQGARFGRRHVLQYSPPEISQICREAGLATGSSAEVVSFWDLLAARARGLHDVRLNEIGRIGERLTLQHEEIRTGRQARWIALESNSDGYDVLSSLSADDAAPLCIEVKASLSGLSGSFFMTRNEWDTAQDMIYFVIHLWDLSRSRPRLAVIDLPALSPQVPSDKGGGFWESVRIPFSCFSEAFSEW